MARAGFLTFTIPAATTRPGALTAELPGCRVDVVGRPLIRPEGHAYRLHGVWRGVPATARRTLEVEMQEAYESFSTVSWDEGQGVWEVEGVVPIESIRDPIFRFVAGLFGLTDAPWVVFQGGQAHVRLHARVPEALPGLAERVHGRLAELGVLVPPQVESLALEEYRDRAARIGLAVC